MEKSRSWGLQLRKNIYARGIDSSLAPILWNSAIMQLTLCIILPSFHLLVCMCVCPCVFSCVYVCAHVHVPQVEVGNRPPLFMSTVFIEAVSLSQTQSADLACITSQLALGILFLPFQRLVLEMAIVPMQHLRGFWESKLGPHTYTANILITEPSPQPVTYYF